MRDYQRKKVFVACGSINKTHQKEFDDIVECHKYIRGIFDSDWWTSYFGPPPGFTIFPGSRRKHAAVERSSKNDSVLFWLPKNNRNEKIILHLIALRLNPPRTAAHGPRFCATYAFLIKKMMGEKACAVLVEAYAKHGVDFRPNKNCFDVETQIRILRLTGT